MDCHSKECHNYVHEHEICQYGIALPAALWILGRLPKDTNPSEKLGAKGFFGGLCVSFTLMSVGSSLSSVIVAALEGALGKTIIDPVSSNTANTHWAVNLVFYVLLAPIVEELVFRKLFCDRLLPLGEGYAILLSSVIFGLVHGNFYQFFYAFFVGLVFSTIYVKTGRIRYTVIYHMIVNFLGGVVVPWAYARLEPILTDEMITRIMSSMRSEDPAVMEALAAELTPYMLPMIVFSAYELIFSVLSIVGVVVLMRYIGKIKLREGLLPPAKEGRVANILCTVGVAAAITAFVLVFVMSLLL